MLELKALSKTYKTGDRALTDISFSVPAGQVVGLIGPSGAGKSSLIRCINRLVEPTAGSICLGETELTTLNGRALRQARRRIGMIFQEYALVERLTVMENVLSGRLGYVSGWRSITWPKTPKPAPFSCISSIFPTPGASCRPCGWRPEPSL